MSSSDPTLERLYDYTKFHIGVYLLAAGAMITIAGSAELKGLLPSLIKHQKLLLAAIAAMGIAGVSGGVIASSCASAASFGEVWSTPIGPWETKFFRGWAWARVEHTAFWASAALFAGAALWPA